MGCKAPYLASGVVGGLEDVELLIAPYKKHNAEINESNGENEGRNDGVTNGTDKDGKSRDTDVTGIATVAERGGERHVLRRLRLCKLMGKGKQNG